MTDEKATGVILRTYPLTETSLIVHWLSPEFGRISTVAKGARRPKSPFRGKLDLFYLAEFTFNRSRRSDLHNLREVSLRETHRGLREDVGSLQQAAYGAALIEQTTETGTPLPAFFDLFKGFLNSIVSQPPDVLTVFAFEMKVLRELGQVPDLARAPLSLGAKQILEKLLVLEWGAMPRLKLSSAQTLEIQQFLHGFLVYHLGRIPKSRPTG